MSRGGWGFIQQEGFDALHIDHAAGLDAMSQVLPLREGGQLCRQWPVTEAASSDTVQLLQLGEDGRFAAISPTTEQVRRIGQEFVVCCALTPVVVTSVAIMIVAIVKANAGSVSQGLRSVGAEGQLRHRARQKRLQGRDEGQARFQLRWRRRDHQSTWRQRRIQQGEKRGDGRWLDFRNDESKTGQRARTGDGAKQRRRHFQR